MRTAETQTKIIQFEQNYLEGYFQDGTSLAWLDDTITYYSLKGNRIKLSIDSIQHSEDVIEKLARVIDCQNRFNDEYIEIPKDLNQSKGKGIYKKYKIKEFYWTQSLVKITNKGYEVASDDNNARCWLSNDLYRVYIEYLQMTTGKEISKEDLYLGAKNQRKFLLEKYAFKYNEFPNISCANEIENEYLLIVKQFTIFNLPQRWCPAINLIWGYLLSNELIPHPFCYIDFSEHENAHLARITESKMPPCLTFRDCKKVKQEERGFEPLSFPIYGKPNHNYKFKWMFIAQQQQEMIGYSCEDNNILCEQEGFWFIEGSKALFNSKNKEKIDYEVSINAFPLTIRFSGQTSRQIKAHILAFGNYLNHREFVSQKQRSKPSKKMIESDQDIILEEMLEGVGTFKAFKNHMAIVKFYDRVILTMRDSQIKVIDASGKCWIIGSDPKLNSTFGWHIEQASNFYQKVFDASAYQQRMRLNEMLQERKKLSSIFMRVTRHIQQNDS